MEVIMSYITNFGNNLVAAARSIGFKDIIDILMVTFLIYQLIKLIRETRAGQLVKGLLLLVVAYLASNLFDLKMINEIFRYVFQYGLIVLIIIFQPEIRGALEQVGRSNVGKSLSGAFGGGDILARTEMGKVIDCVTESAMYLQQLKMGALIIFERKTNLGEIIATGTMIDATPTSEILGNIFFNKAPLHDGAAVIRNAKIAAAGCILPLSKKDNINSSLGTRHRAAIGISEDTDAVAVVVSEETGHISIAVNGVLHRDYNRITLREALVEYLIGSDTAQKESLPKRVLRRLGFNSKERRGEDGQHE